MEKKKTKEAILANKVSSARGRFKNSLVGMFSKGRVAKFAEFPEDIDYRKNLDFPKNENISNCTPPFEAQKMDIKKFKLRKFNSSEANNVAENLVSSYEKEMFEGKRSFSMVVNKADEKDVGIVDSISSRAYLEFFGKMVSIDMYYRDISVEKKASNYYKKINEVLKDCKKSGIDFGKVFEMSKEIEPKKRNITNIANMGLFKGASR